LVQPKQPRYDADRNDEAVLPQIEH
jgi:hypothetical protein